MRIGIETTLTDVQLAIIGERIVNRFYRGGGTMFGCDWPTMRMIYPRQCRVFQRVKAEYKRRTGQ